MMEEPTAVEVGRLLQENESWSYLRIEQRIGELRNDYLEWYSDLHWVGPGTFAVIFSTFHNDKVKVCQMPSGSYSISQRLWATDPTLTHHAAIELAAFMKEDISEYLKELKNG
jgi:hypothetical protein